MNKIYCDICKKEIQQRNSWHFKLEPRELGTNHVIQLHEVCRDCVNKIKEIINENQRTNHKRD